MSRAASNASLQQGVGTSLAQWGVHLRQALNWCVACLTPVALVRLQRADGQFQTWWADTVPLVKADNQRNKAKFDALELPEAMLLRRQLSLPPLDRARAQEAMALEARATSPFAADDLIWGHALRHQFGSGWWVDLVMASRRQVEAHLNQVAAHPRGPTASSGDTLGAVEVWATTDSGQPVVMPGFGEQRRHAHLGARQKVLWALLTLLGCGALGLAITPTAQLRLRVIEAVGAHDTLARQAATAVQAREDLLRASDQVKALTGAIQRRVDPVPLMAALTKALPDDTVLLNMSAQGGKVTIGGFTNNTPSLMSRLSADPMVTAVKAPTPAVRPPGATKETFVLEFQLAPAQAKPVPGESGVPVVPAPTALGISAPSLTVAASVASASASAPLGAASSVATVPTSAASAPHAASPAASMPAPSTAAVTNAAASTPAKAASAGKTLGKPAPARP